jgi:hypothetical protein
VVDSFEDYSALRATAIQWAEESHQLLVDLTPTSLQNEMRAVLNHPYLNPNTALLSRDFILYLGVKYKIPSTSLREYIFISTLGLAHYVHLDSILDKDPQSRPKNRHAELIATLITPAYFSAFAKSFFDQTERLLTDAEIIAKICTKESVYEPITSSELVKRCDIGLKSVGFQSLVDLILKRHEQSSESSEVLKRDVGLLCSSLQLLDDMADLFEDLEDGVYTSFTNFSISAVGMERLNRARLELSPEGLDAFKYTTGLAAVGLATVQEWVTQISPEIFSAPIIGSTLTLQLSSIMQRSAAIVSHVQR